MKFTIKAKVLQDLVSAGSSVAPVRSSLEIIRNILIEAKDGKITMRATDMIISLMKVESGDSIVIHEEGCVLVDAVKMSAVVGELRDKQADVEVASEASGASVKCGRKRFQVYGQAASEFPDSKFLGSETQSQIEADLGELKEMFSRTLFAAAREAGRYSMQGVLLDLVPGEFRLVATDSRRMAFAKKDRDLVKERVSGLIPSKGIVVLMKMLDNDGNVSLNITDTDIHFRTDSVEIAARLVQGHFPPYDKVIPKYEGEGIIVDREEMIDIVSAASVMNTRESMATTFLFEKDKITLSSSNDNGKASASIDVNNPYDQVIDVDLNPNFFLEALRAMECQSFSVRLGDNSKSAIMLVEKDKMVYVVMPMNKKEKKEAEKKTAASA